MTAELSRQVVLHLHLFKNAGTSVDRILQQNFGARWHQAEFATDRGGNTSAVMKWIASTPEGLAYSTHTLLGPLPRLPGVSVLPVLLLRDPVARIASAYRFEREQQAQTRGALLAKQHGFAGYVHARLALPGDRQCRNFQTQRLAAMRPDVRGSELDRARAALRSILGAGVLGLVSDFDGAMARLATRMRPSLPDFTWAPVVENASASRALHCVSPQMRAVLEETNADDLALVDFARALLPQAAMEAGRRQLAGMV